MARRFENDLPEDVETEIIIRHYALEYDYEQLLKICARSGENSILKEVCQRVWPLKLAYDLGNKDPSEFLVESLEENKPIYAMILLKDYDVSYGNNSAIGLASSKGYLEIVKLLLEMGVDPSANNSIAQAAYSGNIEIVKLLLQYGADPATQNNLAFRRASYQGHTEIVKLLLEDKRVDPTAGRNGAISQAALYKHYDVIKLLLQDERVRSSLTEHELRRYSNLVK